MRTVGLEETQFPLTVDRTLFHGFFALLDLSAAQIVYFVLASETIALVAFAIVFLSTSARVRKVVDAWFTKKSPRENKHESPEPPKEVSEFATFSVQVFEFSAIILFVIIGILLAGFFSGKSGEVTANNFLKKVKEGRARSVEVFLSGQDQPIKAYTLLCSSSHCAFLEETQIVVYRHEKIERTITHDIMVQTDATQ
ncbi:hypothetical protein [Oryzomicrobium sp.]|uniref:hypothetical protein n=1 Tax=Oryzomicrobium sp. TaxID=1911578 RepID=UPI002FE2C946